MKRKKRLIWQLYPSYLFITIISLVAVTWYATYSLRRFFLEQTESDLEARSYLIERQILKHFNPIDEKTIDLFCKRAGKAASTRITVILPSGKVIADSMKDPSTMDNHADRPEILQAIAGKVGISTRHSNTLNKNMMFVGIPLRNDMGIIGVVRTSLPLISIDKAIKDSQVTIVLGGVFIAVFAALLSLLISRRITRPIEEIKKGAEYFARGDLQRRLPVSDFEEIGSLSETMNQMAAQLDDRMKEILRQHNEREAVLSSMVEGVIAVDMDERIIRMNQAASQMLGCNQSESQGRSIQEVSRNSDLQQFVKETLSSKKFVERDIEFYSNGEQILNGHGTILQDEEGRRMGALIVLNDVTKLRKLENVRRDFVANVSHEIKTPITAIKGFTETLSDGAMTNPDDNKRFLDIIGKHVDRLDAIIDDLLSLSKIEQESERNEISLEEGDIKEVLQSAIRFCNVRASPKKIRIEFSGDESIRARINPPLLEQAVINLLDNAIKYSEKESSIQVEGKLSDNEVLINVKDHGIGIAKEHLSRLFERFYRVDKARSRKLGGTGLGLAIVKHIIQAHGGRVSVDSTLGEGSTFSIHFPGAKDDRERE